MHQMHLAISDVIFQYLSYWNSDLGRVYTDEYFTCTVRKDRVYSACVSCIKAR